MLTQQKHNFGAGPCILPPSVMKNAAEAVLNWNGIGLSVLEVSHRSKEFEQVIAMTKSLVYELLNVPNGYQVLFLQGGASTQFSMVPMSFMQGKVKKAGYLDSGFFALKAIAEARHFGEVQIVATSADKNYNYIPSEYGIDNDIAYLHCTSNNTIEGTQMMNFPQKGFPLICDMSSDIFSRKINVADFDLIYAGAQKNMGPAGMTLVIIKDELLDSIKHTLPAMSDYRVFAQHNSLYNTPPVFSIYVTMLNLQWLKEQGGVEAMEELNKEKARVLYQAIDQSELFTGIANKDDRSRMNVTFKAKNIFHEQGFLDYAAERGIVGIAGYKTAGGFRASLYNALPLESVTYLAELMRGYEEDILSLERENRISEQTN